jgi:hypothetical protein
MNDVIEMQILNDDKPIDMSVNFSGEFVSGADGGEYDRGYEDGKNSVVDYLRYAQTVQYIRRDLIDKKEITLNLDCVTNASHLLNNTNWSGNTIVEHITVNIPNKLALVNGMFHSQNPNDTVLKRVTFNVDTSKATLAANMFRGCEALEIIDGTPLDFSSITGASINFLNLCTSLVDIRFAPNTIKLSIDFRSCPNLSAETIQSIIDGLADLTGGTAQTLDLHSDIVNKLSIEQLTQIANKNWRVT